MDGCHTVLLSLPMVQNLTHSLDTSGTLDDSPALEICTAQLGLRGSLMGTGEVI